MIQVHLFIKLVQWKWLNFVKRFDRNGYPNIESGQLVRNKYVKLKNKENSEDGSTFFFGKLKTILLEPSAQDI